MAIQPKSMPRVKRPTRARARTWQQDALRYGLVGGIAGLHLSLVGIVTKFADRYLVGDFLTLGQTMLAAVALIPAYVAARKVQTQPRSIVVAAGTLAGLVAGAALSLLVVLGRCSICVTSSSMHLPNCMTSSLSDCRPTWAPSRD